jgi:hypothetical protein
MEDDNDNHTKPDATPSTEKEEAIDAELSTIFEGITAELAALRSELELLRSELSELRSGYDGHTTEHHTQREPEIHPQARHPWFREVG